LIHKFLKITFISFLILSACSSDEKKEDFVLSLSTDRVKEVNGLLIDLEQDIAVGQVFGSQSEATRDLIDGAVDRTTSAMRLLLTYDGDLSRVELAYNEISSALYLLEAAGLTEVNEEETFEVFFEVRQIHTELARILGRDENVSVLYNYNFGGGIEPDFRIPFGPDVSQGNGVEWVLNLQIDLPKARLGAYVQARDEHAWMVSRSFDISKVNKPSFSYFSSLLLTSRSSEITLFEVVQRVFQTYVILDLQPDEFVEDIPDSRKILIEYNPDEVPKAEGFHDAWLPPRSLEAYKDHKVSIGFLFDTRNVDFEQFYSWTIFDFEIRGAGKIGFDYDVKPYLPEDLGGFQSLSQVFSGPEWRSGRDGVYINSSSDKPTNAVLMTPFYASNEIPFNSERALLLNIEDKTVGDLKPEQTRVLISTDYRAGAPFDLETQEWTVLDFERTKRKECENFDDPSKCDLTEFSIDLTSYQNEDFVIAFQFTSEVGFQNWDINSFHIKAFGQRVFSLPFTSLDANDLVDVYADFNFLDDRLSDYQFVYAESSPEWSSVSRGVNVSGFNDDDNDSPFEGESRMIGSVVSIPDGVSSVVRLRHTVGYVFGRGPLKVEIRKACLEEDQSLCEPWVELPFSDSVMNRRIDDMTTSDWLTIDSKFSGQDVEFSFYYKATKENTPNWTIEFFEVGLPSEPAE